MSTNSKYPILDYFEYDHLPEDLREVSRQFFRLAHYMADESPRNAEASAGMRKLLEAKDCFVRANLPVEK